jgi:arylsulfatase A-like enzyme/Flp pilus assembly protein TadD
MTAGSRARRWHRCLLAVAPLLLALACSRSAPDTPRPRNLLLITIDTLRADHVGAYGWARARTPALDGLARDGVLFERAYAAAPITLPSHATLLTGRYPPGHGARDNGMRVSPTVPTLATELHARGFATAAFVAAFPLDHQFGLNRGFDVYGDRMPRGADGRLANERPAPAVVDDAIGWLNSLRTAPVAPGTSAPSTAPSAPGTSQPFFLWVHLFEPHAPYGAPAASGPVLDRYDEDIATADREVGRLLAALGSRRGATLVVAAGDHGEAFGEHDEYAHSLFVYDTTLRVPLLMSGPGIAGVGAPGRRVRDSVTLADVAPTVMRLLGGAMTDVDGVDLTPAIGGVASSPREIYAESFAPMIEFGWAPLRAVRSGPWKYVAAPRPELFDIERDPGERANVAAEQAGVARGLDERVARYSSVAWPDALTPGPAPDASRRLRSLGYTTGSSGSRRPDPGSLPDPKDRRALAARLAQVMSGELQGSALIAALDGIVREDPRNGQAQLRLGVARAEAGDCARAEVQFHAAIEAGLPSADAYLGLASCLGARRDLDGAERALEAARRLEPDNPAIGANIGILQAARGNLQAAISALAAAVAADPDLHEARFNLAVAYARAGRPADAASMARELLRRLPADAPQRAEVERLLKAVTVR